MKKSTKPEMIRDEIVTQEIEHHYEVEINGKRIYVSKYSKMDEFGTEANTEVFGKNKDKLTEEEQEEVIDFVNEL